MNEGRLHVDVLLLAVTCLRVLPTVTMSTSTMTVTVLVETGAHDDVDQDPQSAGDQHHLAVDLEVLLDDPQHGHVDEDPGDDPDHEDGDDCPEDLGSVPAEGHPLRPRLGGHPDGEDGDHEGGEVGQEVGGVSGDGERVGEDSANHLDRHEEDAEAGGEYEFVPGPPVQPLLSLSVTVDLEL